METTAKLAEGLRFISKGKVSILVEITDMCFFFSKKERSDFIKKVSASVGCKSFEEIKETDFGTAFLYAESILHSIGEKVFRPTQSIKSEI